MCYTVILSTTSPEDLSTKSSEFVCFEKQPSDSRFASKLSYPNLWHAGWPSGCCSCYFRHLMDPQLGFGKPVDWMPEDVQNLEATARFIAVVGEVLDGGHPIDCVDIWGEPDRLVELYVDLNRVTDEEFRFFENYHFRFTRG